MSTPLGAQGLPPGAPQGQQGTVRYQSPFARANNAPSSIVTAKADGAIKSQTFLDKWIEPPPTQRPSFAEQGIERNGVVANMAPLGTMPSPKALKAATRPDMKDNNEIGRESGLSSGSTPQESVETPEPNIEQISDAVTRVSVPNSRQPSISRNDGLDGQSRPISAGTTPAPITIMTTPTETALPSSPMNYLAGAPPSMPFQSHSQVPNFPAARVVSAPHTPQTSTMPFSLFSRQSVPPQTQYTMGHDSRPNTAVVTQPSPIPQFHGQSVFALQRGPLPGSASPSVQRPNFQPAPQRPMIFGPNNEYKPNVQITDKVVETAVQMAVEARRWPTAYALRTLYDAQRDNPRMVRLIDAIFHSQATEEQKNEFWNVMKYYKKQGKAGNTAEYQFNPDRDEHTPEHVSPSFSASKLESTVVDSPMATSIDPMNVDSARRISINQSSQVSASPQHDHHISKKLRGNDYKPTSDLEMNGDSNAEENVPPQELSSETNEASKVTSQDEIHTRSRSNSTSSSLSSVDDNILQNGNISQHASPEHKSKSRAGRIRLTHGGAGAAHTQAQGNASTSLDAETNPSLRNHNQPITGASESGPKTYTFSTVTPTPSSSLSTNGNPAKSTKSTTTTTIPTAASTKSQRNSSASTSNNAAMPSAAPAPAVGAKALKLKKQKVDPNKTPGRLPYDENDKIQRMKRNVREAATKNAGPVKESSLRDVREDLPLLTEPESQSDADDSVSVTAPPPSKARTKLRLNYNKKTRQSQSINDNNSDTLSSPTNLSFQNDLAPGSLSTSRAGTPSGFGRPTRKTKTGTGLRVKMSPMKKKGATAGFPRASGERNSPSGGALNGQDDGNDDYCASCSGNGELVLCDGCTRSFHYICADPPIDKNSILPNEWYCNVCIFRTDGSRREDNGIFGKLLLRIDRKNPSAFHLTQDIREHFEGVKTGESGEYEEVTVPKPKGGRGGWEDAPDYFRLKDSKGKAILCHQCNGQARSPDRAIIPCNFCPLSWHLDCINPPMAKEPTLGKPFRCPAHVNDLLVTIPGSLAPAHRFRKLKNSQPIIPVRGAASRGIRNNGYIEIENELTDDEEEQGYIDQSEYGKIYKLPEKSVKLDFISKVRDKYGHLPRPVRSAKRQKISHPQLDNSAWEKADLEKQQAALNLTALARTLPDSIQILTKTLLTHAPPDVVSMIALGTPEDIIANRRDASTEQSLRAMRDLINTILSTTSEALEEPNASVKGTIEPADVEMAVQEVEVEDLSESREKETSAELSKSSSGEWQSELDKVETIKIEKDLRTKTPEGEKSVEAEGTTERQKTPARDQSTTPEKQAEAAIDTVTAAENDKDTEMSG
ncbi:hypothetical protein B0O99DRAFT_168865 [Bisporella sp. PMI_857]|nr:hypothetical protein B0O99DRAFT_168865 [Bisporella sp. PMI_857]